MVLSLFPFLSHLLPLSVPHQIRIPRLSRTRLAGHVGAPAPVATPNTGYVYKIRIHTEDAHLVVDGETRPVLSGMTVQADIITDRRRVIDFFLSPVVKYLDEGMTVR